MKLGYELSTRVYVLALYTRTPPLAQVQQFYTAPTLIRSLMAAGEQHVKPHDRSSLKVLGTVGEPINPEAWRWYHEVRPSLPTELSSRVHIASKCRV